MSSRILGEKLTNLSEAASVNIEAVNHFSGL